MTKLMKKSKARRAMRKTTFEPGTKSKYSQKKEAQAAGRYSPRSPKRVTEENIISTVTNP